MEDELGKKIVEILESDIYKQIDASNLESEGEFLDDITNNCIDPIIRNYIIQLFPDIDEETSFSIESLPLDVLYYKLRQYKLRQGKNIQDEDKKLSDFLKRVILLSEDCIPNWYHGIGKGYLATNHIYDLLKEGFNHIKGLDRKIMVTHVHPTGTTMERFSKFVPGSKGVKDAVDKFKPNILLCSHVHEAEGIEEKIGNTKVINVGRKGKIINL